MDIPEDTLSPAPGRIMYLYLGALADLTAGDERAASLKVALLSRYYTDICYPLGTASSAAERSMQERYENAVEPLVDTEGETSHLGDLGWVHPGHRTSALSRWPQPRGRELSHSTLVSADRSGDFDAAALTITRLSIRRAANDLADIITTLETARLKDVRRFGATGDGSADDTAAIKAAMKAAARAGTGVYLPAGTYKVAIISIPSGIALQGAGHAASWIKGGVLFGSRDLFSGLRLGDVGSRTHNADNATQTVFESCRFRGTAPIVLGDDHSCSYITFRDCLVERSFGGWTPDCRYNNVIIEEYSPGPYGHVEHITFERCHVGVSNGSGGHDTGSPGAGLVCHVNPRAPLQPGLP